MTVFLRQSTSVNVKIGPFVSNSDGFTAVTGLTLTPSLIRLSKNAGGFAAKNSSANCVHDENGWYTCLLDTTDTGTLGSLQLNALGSGALPVFMDFAVIAQNVWDSLFSTDRLQVDVREKGDSTMALTTQEKADVAANALLGTVETGVTTQSALKLITASTAGKLSGGGTTTLIFRDQADTKNRITATLDVNGNRTNIVTNVT